MDAPEVRPIAVTRLRELTPADIRTLDAILVVHSEGKPLAVLLPYDYYMRTQNGLLDAVARLEQSQNVNPAR